MSDESVAQNTRSSATRAPAVAERESELETSSLQRERDELVRERETLLRERDQLAREHAALLSEHASTLAAVAALGEAKRELDEFLSIASHELKTPLTSIRGYLQIAQRRLLAMPSADSGADRSVNPGINPGINPGMRPRDERLASVRTVLERAEQQTGQMNRLINDLLDASRVQASRLELRLARRDLAVTVRDIVEEQRLAVPGRTLVLESEPGPVVVSMDAARIGQVLTNLLTNALKYAPAAAPVIVRLRAVDERARVEVSDHGPGLAPEEQRRVWDRFYRSPDVVAQHGADGLGLGLYISRAIVERHGGLIGVESTPGDGATFYFTLPLATAPRTDE